MKKITFFLLGILSYWAPVYGQCTNTYLYPSDPVTSNNQGVVQQIADCAYAGDYSMIQGLIVGGDYIFDCTLNSDPSVHRYITVRDAQDNVIAHGESPLAVENITAASVTLHYTIDADCGTESGCSTASLKALLSCMPPADVQPTALTTTTATFNWLAGGSETAWQVLILPDGDDAPSATTAGTPVSGTPGYTTTVPLTEGTNYQFYIRADCGSEFSPWGGPYDFATLCASTALFTQNFESTDIEEVPECWTALLVGADADASIETVDFMVFAGENALQMANEDSPETANIMLVSPPLSTMTTGTHRVKFNVAAYGNNEIEVGTVNSTVPGATFTLKEVIPVTSEYTEAVVDFTDYAGTDTFLAFRHPNATTYNPLFLDNIRWELAPLCPDVTNLNVEGVTTATATIAWMGGGAETQWDIVFGGEDTTDPTALTPISPAPAGTPVGTITGLSPNTTYNAWVRSVCSGTDGSGAWIGPVTFTTACLAVNTLSEDFTATPAGEIPDCWATILEGEELSTSAYIEVSTGSGVEDGKGLRMYNSFSASDSNIIAVSPNLGNLGAGTHRMKFAARTDGSSGLEIGTISSPSNASSFSILETIELTNSYAEYVVDFTGYTGTDTFIAFRHNNASTYTAVMIDNVRWEEAPACADVTDLEIHTITTTSAGVFWGANSGEAGWDVVYGPDTVTDPTTLTPISPAPTVSPGATLNGLTPNTSYNVWVRSACGGTIGNGAWIGPITFTTACLPVGVFSENFDTTDVDELPGCWSAVIAGETASEYAYVEVIDYSSASGDNSVEIYPSDSGADDYVMLISPNLNTLSAGTHRIKFQARASDPATIQVGTLNGNTETAVFTMFEDVEVGEDFAEYVVNFTGYNGTDTYIGFRNVTANYVSIYIDDVKWELAPLCADVTDITINQVGTATASVDWMAGGSEGGWQVVYGPASATDPSTLTPSPVLTAVTTPLTGLTDNTTYNVWVRSVCGGTAGDGAWIGPVSFTTLCVPGTLPYMQDFENAVSPALADCMVGTNEGEGNDWATEENPGYGFTDMVASYTYNSDYAADAWLFTRGLPLTAGTSYKISYKYGDNGNDSWSEKMEVKYGLSPDAASMTLPLADHPEINTDTALTNEVTFTAPTTGTYYFGFHAYSDANQYDIYLDDVSIDVALGNANMQQGMFTYYPNPVKDVLKMSYTNTITNVVVYNMLGQAVINTAVNQSEASIDMSQLPAGNYIVKVSADTMSKTIKVIKD